MSEGKNPELRNLIVRPIKLEEKKLWQELMAKHHYLGDAQLAGESIRYVATLEDKIVALIGWSWPSLKNHNRETWIGWSEDLKMKRLRFIVNNTRFLILPWIKIKHLASKILASNVRRLSSDWEIIYGHPVLLVETFVDESRFKGTCYKAAGWQYLGKTRGFARHRNGYISHGNCKMVFIQQLRKKTKEILSAPFTHPVLVTKKGGVMDINKLPLEGKGGLIDFLKKVPDPRGKQGVRHKLKPLLVVITCACLAGARSYAAIAQWVQSLPRDILLQLGFRMGEPPSETGIRRFMKKLDAQKTDEIINDWLLTFEPNLEGKAIAIDGKTLRGAYEKNKTLPHLISAVLHKEGLVIAQKSVGEKTNEIPELKNLIEDLNIKGSVVTADAIHTQTGTATFIVEEKEADYVFTVKNNQSALKKEIKRFDFEAFSPEA